MNEYSKDLVNHIKENWQNILYDFLNQKKKKKKKNDVGHSLISAVPYSRLSWALSTRIKVLRPIKMSAAWWQCS